MLPFRSSAKAICLLVVNMNMVTKLLNRDGIHAVRSVQEVVLQGFCLAWELILIV